MALGLKKIAVENCVNDSAVQIFLCHPMDSGMRAGDSKGMKIPHPIQLKRKIENLDSIFS
jgi:hypothetical protein